MIVPLLNSVAKNRFDFTIYQDNTLSKQFKFQQTTDQVTYTPEDLTGCEFTFAAIKKGDPAKILQIDASSGNGMITIDTVNGVATMTVPSDQMSLDCGQYKYDLDQLYPSGQIRTRMSGFIWIAENVG